MTDVKFLKDEYIEFIESKAFLKTLDNVLDMLERNGRFNQKRKTFFFFGHIDKTKEWFIVPCIDNDDPTFSTVYQYRDDDTYNGIPFHIFSRALEYTLIQKFSCVPLLPSEVNKLALEYLSYKGATVVSRDKWDMKVNEKGVG